MRVPVWYVQGPDSSPTPPKEVNCHNCYRLDRKCHHKCILGAMLVGAGKEAFVKELDHEGSDPINGLIPLLIHSCFNGIKPWFMV